MPDRQQPYQSGNGVYGGEKRQQGNIAQGMAGMNLRPGNAGGARHRQANGHTVAHQIERPPGCQPPNAAEMLQRRPEAPQHDPRERPAQLGRQAQPQIPDLYSNWDEDEFLPLRLEDQAPRPTQPPVGPPAAAQRYGQPAPVAQKPHPWTGLSAAQLAWSDVARNVALKSAETVLVGRETYNIISTLQAATSGDGGMSAGVYVVKSSQGKRSVAKHLSLASESKKERAMAELQALQKVKSALRSAHENINSLEKFFLPENGPQGTLLLEYCDAGSLANGIDHYKSKGGSLDEDRVFHLMYGIAKALCMIHHGIPDHTDMTSHIAGWKTICHLDIKPTNILLTNQQVAGKEHMKLPRVVIADFGCSITCDDITSNCETRIVQEFGTPGWYPPEEPKYVLRDQMGRYGKPTDVWQMGGVIQAMCLLLYQPDMNRMQRPLGRKYSPELNCLVANCMSAEFMKRPTAVDLCNEVRAVMAKNGYQV